MAKKKGKKTAAKSEAATETVAQTPAEPEVDDDAILYPSDRDIEDDIPSMEECLKRGYSAGEGEIIIKAALLVVKGPGYSAVVTEPAYIVVCPREAGMWRIGRKFSRVPVTLLASSLTKNEIGVLEACNDGKNLQVEKVNF